MQSGRLRHRVTIQRQTVTRDAYGGEVVTWGTLAEVWALCLPLTGRERYVSAAAQELSDLSYGVRIRHRTDVDPKMRVVWGTKVLDIQSVQDPTGRGAELVLLCRDVLEGTTA